MRELHGGGDVLIAPIVWSEVFAACDDPPAAVRWSELRAVTAAGDVVEPRQLTVTYQAVRDGGCPNTTVEADGRAFVQRTGVARGVPHQATLAL